MVQSPGRDMRTTHPLHIQLGNSAVLVGCDDHALRQSLNRQFRHCRGGHAPEKTTYRIDRADADHRWQLLRDGWLLYRSSSSIEIINRLMQDMTLMLIKHCSDQMLFHAAGLAKGNDGLILCGASGSGKSTLAAWLTAIGFDYLTDELVAVSLDRTAMRGLTRPLVLKSGSAFIWRQWLDEVVSQGMTRFPGGATWLDPEALRPDCVRALAYPRLLLFARYTAGEPSGARPLSTAESAFRLMQHLINAENLSAWGFTAVNRLAQQTTAYVLTYADVRTAADWIKQMVG
jgi:IS1 family transposase